MRPAKQSILYFLTDVGTSVVGFLATLYFARALGAGPLGKYFVVVALIGWLTIPSKGIASAINKRVSEGGEDDTFLSTGIVLGMAYGIVISGVVVVGGRYVNAYVGAEVSVFVAALLISAIVFDTTQQGLIGQKKVATVGFLRTGDRVFRVLAQVALVYLGYSVLGLVGGHALGAVGSAAIGLVLFGFRPSVPDRKTVRSVVAYSRYSWLGSMKSKTSGWMDTLVLAFFVSSELVGVYEVSWRLASILVLVSNAVQATLFPEISSVASDEDHAEVRKLLSEALFYAGIFVIPGFFGALVLAPRLLRIYGPEFVDGAPILLILILARTVNVYESQILNVINGVDRPDIAFRINAVFIAVNVGLNVLLVWQYGWFGAAVATTLSSVVILVLSYRAVNELIGYPRFPLGGISRQIAASTVMALAVVAVDRALPLQNMYVTVALVGFGAAVYGGLLYAMSARLRTKVHSLVVG